MIPSSASTQTRALAYAFLFVSVFAFSAVPAQAQVSITPGIRGGGNFATFGGGDSDEYLGTDSDNASSVRRKGLMIGGYVTIDMAGPIAIQPELLYTQKGAGVENTSDQTDAVVTQTTKLDYLEVPVLAVVEIPSAGFSPMVFAGPSVGFNMGATQSTSCENVPDTAQDQIGCGEDVDISDVDFVDASSVDFGLVLGAGAGFGGFNVDLRYQLGLSNPFTYDVPDQFAGSFEEPSIANRGLMITAGYSF